MSNDVAAVLEPIVAKLVAASWSDRDGFKAELLAAAGAVAPLAVVQPWLEERAKSLEMELRWELEEVIEDLQPAPEPEPEPEEEAAEEEPVDPNAPLKASDLDLVYDDPRGIRVHRTKKEPKRWFLTQMDPYSGQPRSMELQPTELAEIKTQLAGSPYWVLGSGAATGV